MTRTSRDAAVPRSLRVVPHLLVATLGYTLFVVAGLPELLTARYDVSLAAFGLLTSVPLGAFVLAQPLASRLADRRPTTRVLLWAGIALAAIGVALDLVSGFAALLGLRFVWGLVAGLALSVGATHIARLSGGGTGTLSQGVYGGTFTFGGAVAFLVGGPVVATTGGFGTHALGGLTALAAVAICWRYRTDRWTAPRVGTPADDGGTDTGTTPEETAVPSPLATVTDRTVLLGALVYAAIIGSYVTLATFVTAFFGDLGVLGPLNALVLVGASLGRVAGGAAVWRFAVGDATLVAGSTLVAAVGFGALALGPGTALLLALPFVTMLAVSLPFGAVFNLAAGATEAEGTALATVVAAGNVAALVLPPVSGALREASGSYSGPFAVLALLNLVAVASALALARGATTHQP